MKPLQLPGPIDEAGKYVSSFVVPLASADLGRGEWAGARGQRRDSHVDGRHEHRSRVLVREQPDEREDVKGHKGGEVRDVGEVTQNHVRRNERGVLQALEPCEKGDCLEPDEDHEQCDARCELRRDPRGAARVELAAADVERRGRRRLGQSAGGI